MTYKQIREIKKKFQGLTLIKNISGMFNNEQWVSVWEIKYLNSEEMKDLIKYLDNNKLIYYFSKPGIHIQ